MLTQSSTPALTTDETSKVAIRLENLTKKYGANRGVTGLNLEIKEGEVFGFLGPNGAGKTTTIRMLLNLIKPTSGRALLNGLDSQHNSLQIKKYLGYLPGEFSLYPNLTGAETLKYFANMRGGVDWKYILHLAQRLELDMSKKFRQYSRGNKQKVGIIQALMHRPRLLILDEPTGGLDPLNQQEFYRLVQEVRTEGRTIFFSSHIMSEVEKCCDRVGIIREGQLVKVGQIDEMRGLRTQQLEMTFGEAVPVAEFECLAGVESLEKISDHELHCVVHGDALDTVIKVAARYRLVSFINREPSLEEIFLNYYKIVCRRIKPCF